MRSSSAASFFCSPRRDSAVNGSCQRTVTVASAISSRPSASRREPGGAPEARGRSLGRSARVADMTGSRPFRGRRRGREGRQALPPPGIQLRRVLLSSSPRGRRRSRHRAVPPARRRSPCRRVRSTATCSRRASSSAPPRGRGRPCWCRCCPRVSVASHPAPGHPDSATAEPGPESSPARLRPACQSGSGSARLSGCWASLDLGVCRSRSPCPCCCSPSSVGALVPFSPLPGSCRPPGLSGLPALGGRRPAAVGGPWAGPARPSADQADPRASCSPCRFDRCPVVAVTRTGLIVRLAVVRRIGFVPGLLWCLDLLPSPDAHFWWPDALP